MDGEVKADEHGGFAPNRGEVFIRNPTRSTLEARMGRTRIFGDRRGLTSTELYGIVRELVADELLKMDARPDGRDRKCEALDRAVSGMLSKMSMRAGMLNPDMFDWS